jgi:glycyl-tRNA synthetase beta chain
VGGRIAEEGGMSMSIDNLLVELFVEELPPKALKKLGDAFAGVLLEQLKAQGLASGESQLTAFASPRRLAAHVTAVAPQAPDKALSQKLMPASVGLDASGNATPALLKKLQALGADASAVPKLKRAMDGKAEALFYDSTARGVTLAEGLQKALNESLSKLPIPKVMTYQLADGWTDVKFVRPAHALWPCTAPRSCRCRRSACRRAAAPAATASRRPARPSPSAMPTATPQHCASRAR